MNGPNNKIISYDPELDIIRIMRNGTEYNIQGDVIAELWNYYVQGRPDEYDICESCPNVEQEHGRWIRTDAYPHRIYCSECYATFIRNDEFLHLEDIPHNYCPKCGARMDAQIGEDKSHPFAESVMMGMDEVEE